MRPLTSRPKSRRPKAVRRVGPPPPSELELPFDPIISPPRTTPLVADRPIVKRPKLRIAPSVPLFTGVRLAAAMGVSLSFVLAMKRAGYVFTHGHQTTVESALAWRMAFPEFRTHTYLQRDWQKQPKLRMAVGQGTPLALGAG